jgi:plasmid stabilization system protein ParE
MGRPVVLRETARDDVEAALASLLKEAGVETAMAFIDELDHAYAGLSEFPGMGYGIAAVGL